MYRVNSASYVRVIYFEFIYRACITTCGSIFVHIWLVTLTNLINHTICPIPNWYYQCPLLMSFVIIWSLRFVYLSKKISNPGLKELVVYLIDYWKRCSNILKNQAFILQLFSINGDLTLENIFFALIKLFDSDNVSRWALIDRNVPLSAMNSYTWEKFCQYEKSRMPRKVDVLLAQRVAYIFIESSRVD